MRPFIFQNHSTKKPIGTVVIDFLDTRGSFHLVYKKGSTYVECQPKDLLRASVIKINYAYLGGEHFCNYTLDRQPNSLRFTLNKAMLESGDYVWDINKAAFLASQDSSSESNGLSPIHDMEFSVSEESVSLSSINTFRRLALAQGLDYPVTWDTSTNPQTLSYQNPGTVNINFSIFKNWGLGLETDTPALLNWRWKHASSISMPLAFTYFAPAAGEQRIEMICRYTNSFNINNPTPSGTSRNGVCVMDNSGALSGPSVINVAYRNFVYGA